MRVDVATRLLMPEHVERHLLTPVGVVQRLPTPADAVRCHRIRAAVVRAMPHAVAVAVAATPQPVARRIPAAAVAGAVRAGTDALASRLTILPL